MGTKLTSLADRTLQFLRECYDPICVLTCLALALVPLSVCAVLYRRCKHLAKSFNSVARALIILCIVECLVILLRPLFNLHGAPAYLSGILIWTVLAAFLVFRRESDGWPRRRFGVFFCARIHGLTSCFQIGCWDGIVESRASYKFAVSLRCF